MEGESLSFSFASEKDTQSSENWALRLVPSLAIHIQTFGVSPVNSALKLLHINYFSPSPLTPLQVKPKSLHLDHYSIS